MATALLVALVAVLRYRGDRRQPNAEIAFDEVTMTFAKSSDMSPDDRHRELAAIRPAGMIRLRHQHVAIGNSDCSGDFPTALESAPAFLEVPAVVRLLITPREAASALAISTRKLWSLTNAGEIPCVRLGRCVRYSPIDLQDWIQGQRRSLR